MRCLGHSIGAALWLLGGAAAAAPPRARVVLMPPENASAQATAPAFVGAALAARLAEEGWEVADPTAVEGILRAARARRVDSLPETVRRQLAEETSAGAVLFSTVETWLEGADAMVALSARLVGGEGELLWSAVAGIRADETAGALGFHRASSGEEVARVAIERLTERLPRPGEPPRQADRRARPLHAPPPTTFRSTAVTTLPHQRVFLLPFVNLARAREAPRQLALPLLRRLAGTGSLGTVESADLRAALLGEKIPSISWLDAARLRAVARRLGTPLYLRGTIFRWREGSAQTAAVMPQVELELELVDAESERVLWAAHHARDGADYEGLLLRGAIPSAVALADQLLAEMVESLLDAKPAGPPRRAVTARPNPTPTLSPSTPGDVSR